MDPTTEARRQRLWLLGASAVVVVAVVAIAIAIGRAGGDTAGTTTGTPEGIAGTRALFAGIPQRGVELGDPRAPVTLADFGDLQCPFCGKSAREALPEIVRRYVRPGRVKVVFRNLAFLGEDSLEAARMAGAAALQNRLWQFVDLVYRNMGEENAGWVTDAYLRRVARGAGLDVRRAFGQRGSAAVTAQLAAAKAAAKAARVPATPSFVVSGGASAPKLIRSGDLGDLTEPLDRALARP
jgi:protein-disulfide isomerase